VSLEATETPDQVDRPGVPDSLDFRDPSDLLDPLAFRDLWDNKGQQEQADQQVISIIIIIVIIVIIIIIIIIVMITV